MLKIVYPIGYGMDVHKSFEVISITVSNDHGVTTYKSKQFSIFIRDLCRCVTGFAESNCKEVVPNKLKSSVPSVPIRTILNFVN